ncbi:hypothetical protein LINPERHAP2_LOCUS32367, partial [Linum perenne]
SRSKLQGALSGFQLTWEVGHRQALIHTDSQDAIDHFNDHGSPSHQYFIEVIQFKELLAREWTLKTQHAYREGNQTAYYLAGNEFNYPLEGVTRF